MLDTIQNPVMTMFDSDFLSYANSSIMSKTLVAFIGIWVACRFFDIVTDRETKPSGRHLLVRGLLAFFVPFGIALTTEYAQTMPSSYRLYGAGSYDIGTALPAGTYSLFSGASDASVTLKGDDGEDVSQKWHGGSMSVTVYDGDVMTLEGCSARNTTASLVYNANARTMAVANGSTFFVGGVDLRPGTYEITSLGDDSAYEVRDGYLQVGSPLDDKPFAGVVYADVHYGEVLYARDASVVLYSNVFANPRVTDEESEEGDTADGKQETTEDDAGQKGDEQDATGDKDGEGSKDPQLVEGPESTDNKEGDKATKEKARRESDKAGAPADKENATDKATDADASKSAAALIAKVSQAPWTRSPYVPQNSVDNGTVDGEDDLEALDGDTTQTVHDMVRRVSVTTAVRMA